MTDYGLVIYFISSAQKESIFDSLLTYVLYIKTKIKTKTTLASLVQFQYTSFSKSLSQPKLLKSTKDVDISSLIVDILKLASKTSIGFVGV